jgi:ABC-type branched-subunit amino acid transport system substrate-binding protein
VRPLLLVLLALVLAGCGDQTSISAGGRVSGGTLTVYSFLPHTGPRAAAARQIELGEKLALQEAHGEAGAFVVNYAARNLPTDVEAIAHATRDIVLDQGVIAVLGDLDSRTARVTVPLLDAAGVLHVSPGVTGTGFANPSGDQTYGSLMPDDRAQAQAVAHLLPGPLAVEAEGSETAQALADAVAEAVGETVPVKRARTVFYAGSDPVNALGAVQGILAENRRATVLLAHELSTTDLPQRLAGRRRVLFVSALPEPTPAFEAAFRQAYRGEEPTPLAALGFNGMREVLAAIDSAGAQARSRRAVIEAYFARSRPQHAFALSR